MKTIGLLGGLTYASTIEYYRYINKEINKRLGGSHSASIILKSIDYASLRKFNYSHWDEAGKVLEEALIHLDECRPDCILICNNTHHKSYEFAELRLQLKAPVFHIVDCMGDHIRSSGYRRLLLLATRLTMEDGFYAMRLKQKFGIEVEIPDENDRMEIQRIIQEELAKDAFPESSKKRLLSIISSFSCDAAILGCTELPLILKQEDTSIRLLNSVEIHANKAIEFALA